MNSERPEQSKSTEGSIMYSICCLSLISSIPNGTQKAARSNFECGVRSDPWAPQGYPRNKRTTTTKRQCEHRFSYISDSLIQHCTTLSSGIWNDVNKLKLPFSLIINLDCYGISTVHLGIGHFTFSSTNLEHG